MADRWIVIPNWDEFQHYKDRDPAWIKNYVRVLHSDQYRQLSLPQRGLLHGIWLEYAASHRQLRDSTLTLSRALGQRVLRTSLDALNHAGFIQFAASKPLAPVYKASSPEKEKEKEKTSKPPANALDPRAKKAQNWIRNGLAAEVPADQLEYVIADEFKLDDPTLIGDLVTQALEARNDR